MYMLYVYINLLTQQEFLNFSTVHGYLYGIIVIITVVVVALQGMFLKTNQGKIVVSQLL